jgi:NAD(P)H dehydrogenase (quinone)
MDCVTSAASGVLARGSTAVVCHRGMAAAGQVSAMYPDGGLESTILALNNVFYHWGRVLVPPAIRIHQIGEAGGNPYGAAFPSAGGRPTEAVLAAARHQGRRLAHFAGVIAGAAVLERPTAEAAAG